MRSTLKAARVAVCRAAARQAAWQGDSAPPAPLVHASRELRLQEAQAKEARTEAALRRGQSGPLRHLLGRKDAGDAGAQPQPAKATSQPRQHRQPKYRRQRDQQVRSSVYQRMLQFAKAHPHECAATHATKLLGMLEAAGKTVGTVEYLQAAMAILEAKGADGIDNAKLFLRVLHEMHMQDPALVGGYETAVDRIVEGVRKALLQAAVAGGQPAQEGFEAFIADMGTAVPPSWCRVQDAAAEVSRLRAAGADVEEAWPLVKDAEESSGSAMRVCVLGICDDLMAMTAGGAAPQRCFRTLSLYARWRHPLADRLLCRAMACMPTEGAGQTLIQRCIAAEMYPKASYPVPEIALMYAHDEPFRAKALYRKHVGTLLTPALLWVMVTGVAGRCTEADDGHAVLVEELINDAIRTQAERREFSSNITLVTPAVVREARDALSGVDPVRADRLRALAERLETERKLE